MVVQKTRASKIAIKYTDELYWLPSHLIEFREGATFEIVSSYVDRKSYIREEYFKQKKLKGKTKGKITFETDLLPFVYEPTTKILNNPLYRSLWGYIKRKGAIIYTNHYPFYDYNVTFESDSGNDYSAYLQMEGVHKLTVKTEEWIIEYLGNNEWSVYGTKSGWQYNAYTHQDYDNGIIKFKISPLSTGDYDKGDTFHLFVNSYAYPAIYETKYGEEGDSFLFKPLKKCDKYPTFDLLAYFGCEGNKNCGILFKNAIVESAEFNFTTSSNPIIKWSIISSDYEFEDAPILNYTLKSVYDTPLYQQQGVFYLDEKQFFTNQLKIKVNNNIKELESLNSKNGLSSFEVIGKQINGTATIDFTCIDDYKKFIENKEDISLYYHIGSDVLISSIRVLGSAEVLDIFDDKSCKALFTFDDTLVDKSGNYIGEWVDDVGYYVEGHLKDAVCLDDNKGVNTTYQFDGDSFSVSGWFFANSLNDYVIQNLSKGNGFSLFFHPSSRLIFYVYNDYEISYPDKYYTDSLPLNTWIHYVINFDKINNYVEVYVNGRKIIYGNADLTNITKKDVIIGKVKKI